MIATIRLIAAAILFAAGAALAAVSWFGQLERAQQHAYGAIGVFLLLGACALLQPKNNPEDEDDGIKFN